jgi:hypothetical protein
MKPTVCVVYTHAKDHEDLHRSLEIMGEKDWVTKLAVLSTDETYKPLTAGKTTWVGRYFGEGYAVPLDEGGYDQMEAREESLWLARSTKCDWIVVCDADEYFTDDLYREICAAEKAGQNMLLTSVMNFCSLNEILWVPDTLMEWQGKVVRKPFPRVLRSDLPVSYRTCEDPKLMGANPTQHCFLPKNGIQTVLREIPDVDCWIHTRHLLHKRNAAWLDTLEKRAADPNLLHPVVRQAWWQMASCSNI